MEYKLMTPETAFRPVRTLADMTPLGRAETTRRTSWRVTFTLAAITFTCVFAVVAFVGV